MNGKQEADSRHLIDDCPERWEARVFICTYEQACTHTHILSHTHTHTVPHTCDDTCAQTSTQTHADPSPQTRTDPDTQTLAPEPTQRLGLPNCISENEKEETE